MKVTIYMFIRITMNMFILSNKGGQGRLFVLWVC
jgi:hypothetical protein